MYYTIEEILETVNMIQAQHLDIRTVTMGINLRGCISPDIDTMNDNIYKTITTRAARLVSEAKSVEAKFGIPIVNKRISVTPIATLLDTPLTGKSESRGDRRRSLGRKDTRQGGEKIKHRLHRRLLRACA